MLLTAVKYCFQVHYCSVQIDTVICVCGTGCGYDCFLMSGQMVSILFLPFWAECVKKHKPLSRSVVSLRVRAMSRQFNFYFCCR